MRLYFTFNNRFDFVIDYRYDFLKCVTGRDMLPIRGFDTVVKRSRIQQEKEKHMDNKEPSSGGLADMQRMLEAIKAELSTGLDSVKKELKADLKTELDGMRAELKAELDGMKTRETGPRVARYRRPPRTFAGSR